MWAGGLSSSATKPFARGCLPITHFIYLGRLLYGRFVFFLSWVCQTIRAALAVNKDAGGLIRVMKFETPLIVLTRQTTSRATKLHV